MFIWIKKLRDMKKGDVKSIPFLFKSIYIKNNMCRFFRDKHDDMKPNDNIIEPDNDVVITPQEEIDKNDEAVELLDLNINEIIQVDFPDNQYYKEETEKKQIVLHHTVSGQGVDGDISWWRQTADRIGTAIIIGWDGKIYQCFSTKYWAHHLGCKTSNNTALNKASIGIEIDAWGALLKHNDKWYPASWDDNLKKHIPNVTVKPIQNVQEYPNGFMGFYAYEKYTDAQIDSVRKLLKYWNVRYGIPLTYNEDMWDKSSRALSGEPGVWTHVSFRGNGKSDCHPQSELIQMLKSLA